MNTVKELVSKINQDILSLRVSERLKNPNYISSLLQSMALEKIVYYIPEDQLEEFVNESEKSFKESTFKKFIPNYEEFLRELEADFWASVILSDIGIDGAI
ncbi:MAG: hypothetical protein LBH96_04125 [Candidatus Peribacteria bacterium]|jgi:hypothetical protein|nr:hypothetical protein [Candidatus Peribacteria bacterium]